MSGRSYLAAPYEAREQVKALGARWDREAKAWYVPPGLDPEPFSQWRSKPAARDPSGAFAEELRRAGFVLSGVHPVMDGKIHRVAVQGDKGAERNGSYCGFLDGVPNGWHQNFKTADKPIPWKGGAELSDAERASLAASAETTKRAAQQQRDQEASAAAQQAAGILAAALPATGGHPYLAAKQVHGDGLFIAAPGTVIQGAERQINISGRLLVPIRNAIGAVTSLQIIDDKGGKMFLRGGKVAGGQHVIGNAKSPWPLHIAEGYATAATIHEATGHAVVVAFTAHNLAAVAAQHRAAGPDRSIFIAADNDRDAKRNVGLEAATAAAAAIDGHVLVPALNPESNGTDWNDAMRERGMTSIRTELAVQQAIGARQKIAKDIADARGYGRAMECARARTTLGMSR